MQDHDDDGGVGLDLDETSKHEKLSGGRSPIPMSALEGLSLPPAQQFGQPAAESEGAWDSAHDMKKSITVMDSPGPFAISRSLSYMLQQQPQRRAQSIGDMQLQGRSMGDISKPPAHRQTSLIASGLVGHVSPPLEAQSESASRARAASGIAGSTKQMRASTSGVSGLPHRQYASSDVDLRLRSGLSAERVGTNLQTSRLGGVTTVSKLLAAPSEMQPIPGPHQQIDHTGLYNTEGTAGSAAVGSHAGAPLQLAAVDHASPLESSSRPLAASAGTPASGSRQNGVASQSELALASPSMDVHFLYHLDWEIRREEIQLVREVGRGGFATVHRGLWRGAPVAVKQLHADLLQGPTEAKLAALRDFANELEIMGGLAHPRVVQFLGACTSSKPWLVVTEYLGGGTLEDLLHESRRRQVGLGVARSMRISKDIASGLSYLHNKRPRRLVHRDLKPGNVLIESLSQIAKISDFGLGKALHAMHQQGGVQRGSTGSNLNLEAPQPLQPERSKSAGSHGFGSRATSGSEASPEAPRGGGGATAGGDAAGRGGSADSLGAAGVAPGSGAVLGSGPPAASLPEMTGETGSYRYMSGEVFRHEPYTEKVDLYSLGLIMWECFEGTMWLRHLAPVEACRQMALEGARPPFTGRTPAPVQALIRRCWAPRPEDRPTAREVHKELCRIEEEELLPGVCYNCNGSCTVS